MGLDETRDGLAGFQPALEDFVDNLRSLTTQRTEMEDRLQGLWDDSFQREFQRRLAELVGPLDRFTEHESHRFLEFIDRKRALLEGYLDG